VVITVTALVMKLTALLKSAADTGVFVMIFPPRHNSLLNGTSLFVSWFIGAFLILHGTRRALRYGVRHGRGQAQLQARVVQMGHRLARSSSAAVTVMASSPLR
jgi:hypothetical protein